MKLIVTDLLGSFKKSVDTLVFPNKAKEENPYRAITFRWFVVPAAWRSLAWMRWVAEDCALGLWVKTFD